MFYVADVVAVVVVVVVGGRILTRWPYRVRQDISTALPGSSVRMLSGTLTLPKISCRVASVPGHSVNQCSTVWFLSPSRTNGINCRVYQMLVRFELAGKLLQ